MSVKRGILCIIFFSLPVYAGPPYQTNDTDVALYKQLEVYLYSTAERNKAYHFLQAPALEFDYGLLPNFEITANLPYGIALPHAVTTAAHGMSDIAFAFEYRFIQETSLIPAVAFSPMMTFATGNATQNLGNGKSSYQTPLWLQKTIGSWIIDTGGGYQFNNGGGGLFNYPFGSFLLQKNINERVTFGTEIYAQGASLEDVGTYAYLNSGFTYNFTPNFSLLFSTGHSIAGAQTFVGYLGLYWQTAAPDDYKPDLR